MVFINNEKNNINDMLKLAIKNNNIEFELLYGKSYKEDINKEQFTNILNYCKDIFDINDTETYLDIKYLDPNKFKSDSNNYRFTIIGLTDIKKYCKTNILDIDMNFELLEKKPYEDEDEDEDKKNNDSQDELDISVLNTIYEYYTKSKSKEYRLHSVRLDVEHINNTNEQIHNDLIYIRKIHFDYEIFYVYTNKFNINKHVWNYNPEDEYNVTHYDLYWDIYEMSIYNLLELQFYQNKCIESLLKNYITKKSDTQEDEQPEVEVINKKNNSYNTVFKYLSCNIS